MGSYTNPKGRFVEHIGYYLPRKGATVQRAIIFNKPRFLYWLATGAQPSRSVHRMLSYVDMMPKPLPRFGTKYMYEKPPKEYSKPEHPDLKRMGAMKTRYEEVKSAEEMNLLERELRTQYEISKQAKWNEEDDDVELVDSDAEDPVERTKTFHKLRRHLLEFEKDVKKLDIRKRDVLFRKMNKLASKGLVNIDKPKKKNEEGEEVEQLYGTTAEERIARDAKMAKLMKEKRKQYEKILHDIEMENPITQEDFAVYLAQNRPMKLSEAQDEALEYFEGAKQADQFVTKHDAEMAAHPITSYRPKEFTVDHEDPRIASRYPITPFPDIWTFDPYNYYDTKVGYGDIDDPNRAYDTLKDNGKPERLRTAEFRRKQNKGRKRARRWRFSTVNSCSTRLPFACQPNLSVAYTGLMTKISSSWRNEEW